MRDRKFENVEAYAELMAQIHDPSADPRAVLAEAGLTLETLRTLRDEWCVRFASAENSKELVERFERVFRETRENARKQRAAARAATRASKPIENPADPSVVPPNAPPAAIERFPEIEVPNVPFVVAARDRAPAPVPVVPAMVPQPEAPSAEVASSVPPAMRHFTDIRETELAVGPPPAGPLLPFDPSAQPTPPEPRDSLSSMPKGMRSFTSMGETRPAPDAPAGPALPFATAQDEAPRLSLDEHARLCVELALYPAHRPAILQRYGLDEDQRQELAAYWGARINADATLRMSWDNRCAAHRAQLLGAQNPKR